MTENICGKDYFACDADDPVKCVPKDWWCDGHADCDLGGDERNCSASVCHETEIACKSGTQCFPKLLRCDGTAQCLDRSDEDNCSASTLKRCDSFTQFDCNNDGLHCIPLSKVCDGKNDCGRNEDEQPGGSVINCQKDDCRLTNNGGCSHFCTNLYTKRVCHCPDGHRLLDDMETCVDIDECSLHPPRCSQMCNNTVGSYLCLCHDGYVLHPDNPGDCVVKEGGHSLLVTLDNGELITLDLETNINIVRNISSPSNSWTNIDVHVTKDSKTTIYWSKLNERTIGETVIKKSYGGWDSFEVISQNQIFKMHNGSFCSGLSFDWLRSLLFWTSSEESHIYVTNTTSRKTSVLLKKGLDNPRSIAVDPFETRLYWIDWGEKSSAPRIETMLMNSRDRRVLVKTGLRRPMGITIDFLDHRLYWSDINPGSIVFIDLNRPLMRKTVISNKLLHPFTVAVFENKVFWSDWRQNQVISVGKTVGDHLTIVSRLSKPMSIQILNQITKPPLKLKKKQIHSCLNSNFNLCSDICLPSPPTMNSHFISIRCLCSIGSVMSYDKQSCIYGSSSLILPKNINRFTIIVTVIISLVVVVLLFFVIIVLYFCRGRLCSRSCKTISRHGIKHPIVTGDLMFIFKCHSHSSQLSELLGSDFNSISSA